MAKPDCVIKPLIGASDISVKNLTPSTLGDAITLRVTIT